MSERVFYVRWPKETEYMVLPGTTTSTLPIFPLDYFYLMERGLVVYGETDLLRCSIDLSEIEPDKKIIATFDVTKEGRKNIKTSHWQIRKFKPPVPDIKGAYGVIPLTIEIKEIEKVMKARHDCERALEEFGKEIKEYTKSNPVSTNSFTSIPLKTDPFHYQEIFSKVCTEVFTPYIEGQ